MSQDAVVRERGYSGYEGARNGPSPIVVLARRTASTLVSQRGTRRMLIFAFVPALIAGVVMYLGDRVGGGAGGADYPLRLLTHVYGAPLAGLVVALGAAGGTIAEDRRAGALSFYFARPLAPLDYLLGRFFGVFAVAATAMAVPATAVALFRALLASDTEQIARALGLGLGVAILGLLLAAIVSLYALLGGALASSRGAAQSFVGLAFVLPWIAAGIAGNVVDGPWPSLLSLPHLVDAVGAGLVKALGGSSNGNLLDMVVNGVSVDRHTPLPVWGAALALVAIGAAGFAALRSRVERLGRAGGEGGGAA